MREEKAKRGEETQRKKNVRIGNGIECILRSMEPTKRSKLVGSLPISSSNSAEEQTGMHLLDVGML